MHDFFFQCFANVTNYLLCSLICEQGLHPFSPYAMTSPNGNAEAHVSSQANPHYKIYCDLELSIRVVSCVICFCISQGSIPASTEGDARSSEGKERNAIQKLKGSFGSLNMVTEKNKNELDKTSGAVNGIFSQR